MDQATTNVSSPSEALPSEPTSQESLPPGVTPISDLVARADFPECSRGLLVNIGGYQGTVVDIVGHSLKVRSTEQTTMSFNANTLKRLYGPREEQKPIAQSASYETGTGTRTETVTESSSPEPEAPKRNIITEPNFDLPVKMIREFTGRSDFPQCTFGEYVDIGGYKGVVVEIVKGSLKVRSPEEVIRSYNSQVLRKLYPPEK